jgi:hypothetical protein
LLWRPPDLDLLKKFHQRASSEMTPLELEFFRASDEAIERGNRLCPKEVWDKQLTLPKTKKHRLIQPVVLLLFSTGNAARSN